ncbi:MAG: protoheme IX farnesyltransferase [Chlamydiae bacterium]|nr:protoheme IX farnesyltransferase [Chlamydiota bacterium]
MWKKYLILTKPGIIFGNVITAIGGFLLASRQQFDAEKFFGMSIGLALIIAAACVFNNYKDRKIDSMMKRTQKRPFVTGSISVMRALIFGCTLLLLGIVTMAITTNFYATGSALAGFIFYVFVYTPMKVKSVHGTLIGSISGAMPPVVGYTAVSCRLDLASLLLFSIVAIWQMPHFYAIALYRMEEYAKASIPVLPLIKGVKKTKMQMLYYTIAFCAVSLLPTILGYTSLTYLYMAIGCDLLWLYCCFKGFNQRCYIPWARTMFKSSILVITVLSFSFYLN